MVEGADLESLIFLVNVAPFFTLLVPAVLADQPAAAPGGDSREVAALGR